MRLRNIGESVIQVEGITIKPGEDSEDLDNALARKLVGLSPTVLAFSPESVQSDSALAEADAKEPVSRNWLEQ
jgi:hypothetical protein